MRARDQWRYPSWLGWKLSTENLPVHGGTKYRLTSATRRPRSSDTSRMTRLMRLM